MLQLSFVHSGASNPKPSAESPTVQARGIFQGHDDTVDDVQFCPSSSAACGLSKKSKEQIVDIDAADVNYELAVLEYVEDIYSFYKLAESETKTLYLTIYIVDRYLAVETASRRELQLVGISAMLIASKYEESWAPELNDFVCISDKTYSHEQVLTMEKQIHEQLEWYLTVPTPYVFLVRSIKASLPDSEVNDFMCILDKTYSHEEVLTMDKQILGQLVVVDKVVVVV
ncbi:G2/mitotic-specific cyclin S13-6 [Capsicum galapagoense]